MNEPQEGLEPPQRPGPSELTEEAGLEALRGHVVQKALEARRRHGPGFDRESLGRMLADAEIVRFETELRFDAAPLQRGEFGWAEPRGDDPREGFVLVLHPALEERSELLPLAVAYHVPSINYLDVATRHEAELFGAALLGLGVEEYYRKVCAMADELCPAPA